LGEFGKSTGEQVIVEIDQAGGFCELSDTVTTQAKGFFETGLGSGSFGMKPGKGLALGHG
jgi:hypothetical protein